MATKKDEKTQKDVFELSRFVPGDQLFPSLRRSSCNEGAKVLRAHSGRHAAGAREDEPRVVGVRSQEVSHGGAHFDWRALCQDIARRDVAEYSQPVP